jgi:nucleotide-binding universal stress UspA family protein
MPGRDILVVVDDAANVERLLAVAAALAERTEARVTGLFATGLPNSAAYADLQGWAVLVDTYMTARREEAAKAEAAFRRAAAQLKLAAEWKAREGDLTETIVALARLHDLVVLGQPDPDVTGNMVRPEEVILAAGRPVLLVPYAGEFAVLGRNVLVAWNGTREAARALHDAMFLLEAAETVTVLEVDRPGGDTGIEDRAAADVVAALERRGVAAGAETTVSDGTPVADIILSAAADRSADLVVMGAWGHSRLREFVLGGVSRSILAEMTVPVLMSH